MCHVELVLEVLVDGVQGLGWRGAGFRAAPVPLYRMHKSSVGAAQAANIRVEQDFRV